MLALPWLALCTLVAVSVSAGSPKKRASRLALAALVPVLAAGGWACVLHSKYGVFTTGTQFKANLMEWTLSAYQGRHDPTYAFLRDTTLEVDEFVVDDPMPPGSWPWQYRVSIRQALPKLALAEVRNLPRVLKELVIVITPGGILAFFATIGIIASRRRDYPVPWQGILVIAVSAITLGCAYSMLVFDSRYLYPLIPLVLAVAARFLVPEPGWNHNALRFTAIALVLLGMIFAMVYSSSPFRTRTRDFQVVCYDAGRRLEAHHASRVVSVGSGPFPEHGVGWEAGYKAAYFGNQRLVAAVNDLPSPATMPLALADIAKASPGAVIIWGSVQEPPYFDLLQRLGVQFPNRTAEKLLDPLRGEVGTVLFLNPER
jgi:hypothetical protein